MKRALSKAGRNARCLKRPRRAVRAPTVADYRPLAGFEFRAGAEAELTDNALRFFRGTSSRRRVRNFGKAIHYSYDLFCRSFPMTASTEAVIAVR